MTSSIPKNTLRVGDVIRFEYDPASNTRYAEWWARVRKLGLK